MMNDLKQAMKFMKWISLCLIVLALSFGGCQYFNRMLGLKNDNVIESNIEDMIESELGISIDLTPEDPDNDDYSLDMWRKE